MSCELLGRQEGERGTPLGIQPSQLADHQGAHPEAIKKPSLDKKGGAQAMRAPIRGEGGDSGLLPPEGKRWRERDRSEPAMKSFAEKKVNL